MKTGNKTLVLLQLLGAKKWAKCALLPKIMKLRTANNYNIQFNFRCGAIVDSTCDVIKTSITLTLTLCKVFTIAFTWCGLNVCFFMFNYTFF